MNKGKKVEANIYLQTNGAYLAIANIPYIDEDGRKKYLRPHRTHESLPEARAWLKREKAKSVLEIPVRKAERAEEKQILTLGQVAERLLHEKEREGQASFNDTRRQINRAIRFFGEDFELKDMTKDHINGYRQSLQRKRKESHGEGTIASITVNRYLASLRHLLNFAEEEGFLDRAPKVKLLKEEATRKELEIDLSDYLTMVSCLPGPPSHHRALALIGLNTATRWSDASTFTFGQIILKPVKEDDRIVKLLHLQYRSTKTRSGYIAVPILDVTREALEDYLQFPIDRTNPRFLSLEDLVETRLKLEPGRLLFLNKRTGKAFQSMKKALETAVQDAGIARITFHDIRRLMTTIIMEETGDRDLAQDVGRWSDQAMRKHYTSVGKRPRRAFSKINDTIERERQALSQAKSESAASRYPHDTKPISNPKTKLVKRSKSRG